MATNKEEFFGWDDEIESDGGEFSVLKPGKYLATITKVEKTRNTGSGKMNGCPIAKIFLEIKTDTGNRVTVTDNLYLARSMEWKIGMFLHACGLKQKGEGVKASKIAKSERKQVMVTVNCQRKNGNEYKVLTEWDEIERYIDAGETIYNNVKSYEPAADSDDQSAGDDAFGFGDF